MSRDLTLEDVIFLVESVRVLVIFKEGDVINVPMVITHIQAVDVSVSIFLHCTSYKMRNDHSFETSGCSCDENGVTNAICDKRSGACFCKPGFSGPLCNVCAIGYYNYPFCTGN